ncbi:MAG TPA: aromatic ring-hydroxylating dioxygenase subunit alpha [Allosphingosinicella sp.]|jgi:phenylpropionate dioxygenase-like ring-hydroxylating dioxygenase large terminal subunit
MPESTLRLAEDAPDPLAGRSLPGWLYHDPGFFALEVERVLRPAAQIVCHLSDIAVPGAWIAFETLGERILVVRQRDGGVRALANVCRHRGARIADGGSGCARRFTCPYHGWTYDTEGRLIGVPMREDYDDLEPDRLGLVRFPAEIWRGFVFVRLGERGGPCVAEMMAPYEEEIAPYRFEDLRAIGRVTVRPRPVNWKAIADNYSDGLHIGVAHPGLTRLFGRDYQVEAGAHVDRMAGRLTERPSNVASERAYQALLPPVPHLPIEAQRLWLYYKLWPNLAFDIYPDQVDFMQFLPVSPTATLIREVSYALPDGRREMKAARYLNWRINRRVNAEDTQLVARVQQGMETPSYRPGPLGRSEVCLRSFADRLRRIIPEARLPHPPQPARRSHGA